MRRLFIFVLIIGAGLLLVGSGAQGLELGAGASFNTVAMDYLNELIATYNGRMGMSLPALNSGLSLSGNLMLGLSPLDLGLRVEHIAARAGAVDPHGIWESLDVSAVGFLGMGSWTVL